MRLASGCAPLAAVLFSLFLATVPAIPAGAQAAGLPRLIHSTVQRRFHPGPDPGTVTLRKRLLHKPSPSRNARSNGGIDGFLKWDAPFFHHTPDQRFDIGKA